MNGNDYVEIIEAHQQEIEEEFLQRFSQPELAEALIYSDFETLKKRDNFNDFANDWAESYTQGGK